MSMRKLALSARGLTHSFAEAGRRRPILDDVALELYRGEVTLVMGPSGSGKTTLLGVLSGLLRPEAGEVLALGQSLWRLSDEECKAFRLKHCGFVFQGHNLFGALRAREQLEVVLDWGLGRRGRLAREEVERLLCDLGLTPGDINKRPQELSGGEKQRVAIGRALIKEPDLCFADEPTAALDWENARTVARLLQQAADRDAAVLVISHDERLRKFADRVYYLRHGRLHDTPAPEGGPDGQGAGPVTAEKYPEGALEASS
jgi:putative ABC transport system ATP-binding protein